MKTIYKMFAVFFLTGIVSLSLYSQTMNVSPPVVNFGSVPVGQPVVQQFTISNPASSSGGLIVTVPSLQAPYSVTPSGQHTIPVGGSKTYQVTFIPTTAGAHNKTFSITNNSINLQNPYSINLNGTGTVSQITMSVSPPFVNFNNVPVGQSSTQQFTITNPSSSAGGLIITIPSLQTPYSVAPSGQHTIPIGGSKTFQVTFSPTGAGTYNRTLSITNNSVNLQNPYSFSLNGTGTVNQITMSVSVPSINFGDVKSGQSSTQTINISNSSASSGPLNITMPTLQGPFSLFPSGLVSIAAGSFQAFQVTFSPTSVFNYNQTCNVINNSTNFNTPYPINISGNGTSSNLFGSTSNMVAISVSPASLSFGNVKKRESLTKTIMITNPSNSGGILNISWTSVPAGFTISPSGPFSIAVGGSKTFSVTFTPESLTNYSASWSLITNTAVTTQLINFTGTGIAP